MAREVYRNGLKFNKVADLQDGSMDAWKNTDLE